MNGIRPNGSFPLAAGDPPGTAVAAVDTAMAAAYRIDWNSLKVAGRSCCCPARPAVVAIMPPAPGRQHRTELLLCMHHFRVSRAALRAAGAVAVDLDRQVIRPDTPAYLAVC